MSDGRDLLGPLREADQTLSRATLSSEAKERIGASLAAASQAPRRRTMLVPAMALALGAAAVWVIVRRSPAPPPAELRAGFSLEGSRCSATERAGSLSLYGWCRVRVEEIRLSISSRREAELVRLDDGVRLAQGSAEFEVAHRDSGPPVRVWVSAGVIEVVGTHFIVEQHRSGGHVDLLEGSIRFRAADGTVTPILAGARFAWSDRPAVAGHEEEEPAGPGAAPPPVDAADARAVRQAPAPRRTEEAIAPPALSGEAAAGVIERVHALRAERRYREAVDLLREIGAKPWERRTAEVLSFEEGDLLEHLGDDRAACAHWRAHQARFRGGIYGKPVGKAVARLGCR